MKFLLGASSAMLCLALGISSTVLAQDSGNVGTLTLYGKDGETDSNTCRIPMQDGTVVMGKSYGCKNDDYYYFKINTGQPGIIITFGDSPSCSVSAPVYKYLIVGGRGDELNMTAINALAHDGSTNKTVQGHLETFGSPKNGRLYGKLSCVQFSQY